MRTNGDQILAIDGVLQVAPASTTTKVSDKFELANVVKIGLELIATSDGNVDVLVTLLVSNDDSNYAIQDGYSDIINLTDETRHRKTVFDTAIPAARYGKLQFKGQGTNHASTVVAGIINLIRDQR